MKPSDATHPRATDVPTTLQQTIVPDPISADAETVLPYELTKYEFGFWEIETSSLRDFPQQFRTFEIVGNSDGTVSILTVDVDPVAEDGSPAATSRTYAVAAQQIFNNPIGLLPTASYNAELVVQPSPQMQARLPH